MGYTSITNRSATRNTNLEQGGRTYTIDTLVENGALGLCTTELGSSFPYHLSEVRILRVVGVVLSWNQVGIQNTVYVKSERECLSLTGLSSPSTYTGSDGVVSRTGGQVFWKQEYNRQHQNDSYELLN